MKIVEQSVELEWITPHASLHIEEAARTCYKSKPSLSVEERNAFLDKIIKQNHHESVVEHGCASFRIVCDRGVSHEIVRHRIASYSQESTRYCNYSKDKFGQEITVIQPPGLTKEQRHSWIRVMQEAEWGYLRLLENGATPQIARSVLPTCLKTELVMTANFREWMHFIKLRTAPAAHPQMQEVAKKVEVILQREYPEIFGHD